MVASLKTKTQLKVAIIGSGPSGFYVADAIINSGISVEITLLEKLPCPYGLIRYGVAPDHQKLKRIANTLDTIAEHPSVTFLGNVCLLYTLRAHETREELVCRLLLEKKKILVMAQHQFFLLQRILFHL